MLEFLYFPGMTDEMMNKLVKINDTNILTDAKANNKGTFVLSGHYSNWELLAFSFAKIFGERLTIIAKIQASRGLNEKINGYRELSGNEIIEIGFSLKEIFKKLHKNEIICFLIDQSAHSEYSTYIKFFGKIVPAFSGPAKIALRQRPELLIGYGVRQPDYRYVMNFQKIEYDDLEGYTNEYIKELTQRIQSGFEEVIRKDPGQWLWFHKRFKHMKN